MDYKICHVTSAHQPFDGRIFERMCVSLARLYNVYMIVPNAEDCERKGVHVLSVDIPSGRLRRQLYLKYIYKRMVEVDADIYHFHEPELIPYALKIKKKGKIIIFDSHENVPAQILKMSYVPKFLRGLASKLYTQYEMHTLKRFDGLISVNNEIVDRLKKINPNTCMITNYPIFRDGEDNRKWERKIGFAGTITPNWNIHKILEAIENIDVTFELAGSVTEEYLNVLKAMPSWKKVNFHGRISHEEVFEMLSTCSIGMALESHDNPNEGGRKGSIGVTKMFEYMMKGIPVLATDLDNWIPIIDGNSCGICVDCDNLQLIKKKISLLLDDHDKAVELGNNGINAVRNHYCWQIQENTLFGFYHSLIERVDH